MKMLRRGGGAEILCVCVRGDFEKSLRSRRGGRKIWL